MEQTIYERRRVIEDNLYEEFFAEYSKKLLEHFKCNSFEEYLVMCNQKDGAVASYSKLKTHLSTTGDGELIMKYLHYKDYMRFTNSFGCDEMLPNDDPINLSRIENLFIKYNNFKNNYTISAYKKMIKLISSKRVRRNNVKIIQKRNQLECNKNGLIVNIIDGPPSVYMNRYVSCIVKQNEKRNPYSLTHLAACEVIPQCENYDASTLLSIYITVAHHNFHIRIGDDFHRKTIDLKDVVRYYIHKNNNRSILSEEYFNCLKKNLKPFCVKCIEPIRELKSTRTVRDCGCMICSYVDISEVPLICYEANGHMSKSCARNEI